MSSITDTAIAWWQAGYTPLPAAADGSKRPAVAWKQWQTNRPALPQVQAMFTPEPQGIGLVCGNHAGHLEMLELEGRAVNENMLASLAQAFTSHNQDALWNQLLGGYWETTPSGGVHFYYRVDGTVKPNTKLAMRPSTPAELETDPHNHVQVLIETRGEGGWSVIAPSHGATHPSGKPWTRKNGVPGQLAVFSDEQRDTIHAICATLDRTPAPEPTPIRPATTPKPAGVTVDTGARPGDLFAQQNSWEDLLPADGWRIHHTAGREIHWTRPGKHVRDGVSATTGRRDGTQDCLYVFSTSVDLPNQTPITKLGYWAYTRHNGDFTAAAKQLAADGYQVPREDPLPALRLVKGETPVDDPDSMLWASRPLLDHIYTFALSRMVAPTAVLGAVLVRTICSIPFQVVLPPVIGGIGSLNSIIALVGPSGAGKGAADSAAADAVMGLRSDYPVVTIGSGEGITHTYAHREKGELVMDHHAAMFNVPEVDAMTSIGARQGSTLMSQIRSAFSGEALGFSYADPNKRLILPKHTYRLGMQIGVQPERSGELLGDSDGGTPQRLIWLPATDRRITATPPEQPQPYQVRLPAYHSSSFSLDPSTRTRKHIMAIPSEVAQEIRETHAARARGEGTALDGHAMFAREKIAAALAALDSREAMSVEDWQISGLISAISTRTRNECESVLRMQAMQADENRAKRRAAVDQLIEDDAEKRKLKRVHANLQRKIADTKNGETTASQLSRTTSSRDRDVIEYVLEKMAENGEIELIEKGNSVSVKALPGLGEAA